MGVVIVGGALANKYRNGGGAWERMSWVAGLRRLGVDVYFVEQIAPEVCVDAAGDATRFDASVNLEWFRSVTQWFGVAEHPRRVWEEAAVSVGARSPGRVGKMDPSHLSPRSTSSRVNTLSESKYSTAISRAAAGAHTPQGVCRCVPRLHTILARRPEHSV